MSTLSLRIAREAGARHRPYHRDGALHRQLWSAKGNAYRTDEGSYYFRISSFPQYGKLSKKDFAGMTDGARVDVDEYDKDNARDFALWKAPKPGEQSWDTEIGPGRPGWHIECSTMSMKYLGESFDIHLGGEDLIFPHHENEIAQSEALTGKEFAHFWVHSRFLLVEGEKMSKSLGNFYTLRDLVLMGHKPSSIRFLLASVPYRKQLNFTFDGLTQAAASVDRLRNFKLRLETGQLPEGTNQAITAMAAKTVRRHARRHGRRPQHRAGPGGHVRPGARRQRRRRQRRSAQRRCSRAAGGACAISTKSLPCWPTMTRRRSGAWWSGPKPKVSTKRSRPKLASWPKPPRSPMRKSKTW